MVTSKIKPGNGTMPSAPRSGEEFVERFDVPTDRDVLINGDPLRRDVQEPLDGRLPNMFRRQDRLVGAALDACVILHVYERLKEKASLDELRAFFPGNTLTAEEKETLVWQPGRETPERDASRLALLVKLSQEDNDKTKEKRLFSHFDKVKKPRWERYVKEFQEYWEKKEISGRQGTYPPTRPEDPRLSEVNKLTAATIQLLNPGPKEIAAIEKKEKRKGALACELKDVNRVGVLPTRPGYAGDFIRILEMLHPSKHTGPEAEEAKGAIAMTFEELPGIKRNYYFDQKIFIALDRDATHAGRMPGNRATIAEIKIVPAAMERGASLSAIIKNLTDELSSPAKYASFTTKTRNKVLNEREGFKLYYQIQSLRYAALIKEMMDKDENFKPDYKKLPDFPGDNVNNPELREKLLNRQETYTNLYHELLEMSRRIHKDAVLRESKPWQLQYLRTAIFQNECINDPKGFKRKAEEVFQQKTPHEDNIDNSMLTELAKSLAVDLTEMRSQIRQDITDRQRARGRA
jgi:hypothetical protein